MHHVNLSAKPMPHILQFRNPQSRTIPPQTPGLWSSRSSTAHAPCPDRAREPVRTMNELSSARACRYSSLTGPGSETLAPCAPFPPPAISISRAPRIHLVPRAQPVQRRKHLV
jgi:hypothetical protein